MGCIEQSRGFLGRLARDVRGNTIAIMAAAMMPLAGLIGGGVDMSRLYLTKTRLQQACDAGALAGRKAMGGGSWTTGSGNGSTNDKAETMFGVNFAAGQYGTGTLTKSFSETNGTVTGTASAVVPMTIMKIFGMRQRSVSVSCNAKMEIPNTDVMFVLDVTGSMNCAPGTTCSSSTPVSGAKITGLKSAVKCFYEALERVNTTEVCGNDPTATTSTTTAQIRFGFVPYTVNVNVGKLLPNAYMADSWNYQSRTANTQSVQAWTLGSTLDNQNWSGSWTTSSSPYNTSYFGTFSTYASSATMNDGTVLAATISGATSGNCSNNNTLGSGSSKMAGIQDSATGTPGSVTSTATDQNPPVYPATTQNESTSESRTNTISYGYKYTWTSSACRLQRATPSGSHTTYTQTQTGTATKTISWTQYDNVFQNWTYQQRAIDVSGLKAGSSSWNGSLSVSNLATTNGPSVTLSGSSSATTIKYPTSATVTWDGCIEERQTHVISDTTQSLISADFSPIPSDAYDLNIDMLPVTGQQATLWGPALPGSFWARYGINNDTNCNSTGNTTNNVITACSLSQSNFSYYCPTAASRLTIYNTATNFETYVNGLSAGGNTYHDIGLLWGARLLSPTGLFASSNATTPGGQAIQRHMIFMTDGATQTSNTNYTAYGVGWWSTKQTSYTPSSTNLDDIVNARTDALCTAIKNMNITLWVVSFGGGVDSATETRLSNCATPGHYYAASDNAALLTSFQQIASKISELRLTS